MQRIVDRLCGLARVFGSKIKNINDPTAKPMIDLDRDRQLPMAKAQQILELLSALSYRAEALDSYLHQIAVGVSQLLSLDWSVVTFCEADREKIMASSLDLGQGEHIYSLHGTLTNTVVSTGVTLRVSDTQTETKYGQPPSGYRSYLGVPLKTPLGKTIGTICSFCESPRQFSEAELTTVELFAERAAIAIDNYNLYQQQLDFNHALEREVAKATEELLASRAKLIEKEKLAAIGQFASTIVHEIRNPLTTIVMGLKALVRVKLDERNSNRLSLALEESDRLEKLLREILLFAKPQQLESIDLEVKSFLSEILAAMREMPVAKDKEIRLICSLEQVKIAADRNKFKQVIINLVQNALEAIETGETVICRLTKDPGSSSICISVENGGNPIPKNLLAKICEPFVSNKSGGTGLGLAIVKQIVNAHQGSLSIESDAIEGTKISFTMPIAPGIDLIRK